MLFGDRQDFAIEAGIEPDGHTPGTVWGHMCVSCRGVPLGDPDESYCGLHHAYSEFVWLASHLDSLWAGELEGLDDQAAWNLLNGLLYGYHGDVEFVDGRTLQECQRDSDRWHRFNFLTNWGEQFDGYKSFVLCPPGDSVRILSRRLPGHLGRGVSVSRSGFLAAAAGFTQWFHAESLRLGVPCVP